MKNVRLITVMMIVLMTAASAFAANFSNENKSLSKEIIESNLLLGVKSENRGLIVSSAYHLGELKSDKAVLPLMNVLHTSADESSRIAAALSLSKIGESRGMWAVKRAAQFDSSERVRRMCERFYKSTESVN